MQMQKNSVQICKWLEKQQPIQSSEWKQRLPNIAKEVEESIFKESINKEDYNIKFKNVIELRMQNMLNKMRQYQQRQRELWQQQQFQHQNLQQIMAHHNLQSNSSAFCMMIPTPGTPQNPTGTMRMSSAMENNQGINPTSGTMSNGYQTHENMPINRPGSSSISASIGVRCQVTPQMIPTPGFNFTSTSQVRQQTMPMKSDYNNGSGTPGANSSMLPLAQPQKQQQYNNINGQVGPGMQSDPMNQRRSCQGFGDGMINNRGLEFLGNNMQQLMNGPHGNSAKPNQQICSCVPRTMSNGDKLLYRKMPINQSGSTSMSATTTSMQCQVMPQMIQTSGLNTISTSQVSQQTMNGPGTSKGYMGTAVTYGNSRKPVHQGFSSQKIQQRIPTFPSQQCVSMMSESTVTEQANMTRKFYNPAGPSNMSSVSNVNKISAVAASTQAGRSSTHTNNNQAGSWQIQHATQQTIQPPIVESMPFTNPEKVNFQSYAQMSSRQNSHISGSQQQPQQQRQQSMMTRGGSNMFSRQSALGSIRSICSFGDINTAQAMAKGLPQLVDFEMPFGNNRGGQGQFLGPLANSNALNQNSGLVNGQSRDGSGIQKPDSMLVQHQFQWMPTQQMQQVQQIQRNNHVMIADNNNSNLNNISAVSASPQPKPRPNMLTNNHQAGMQQFQQAIQQTIQQPIVKSEPFTNHEKVNFQPYAQMSSQLNSHISGNQLHQQHQQQQPTMTRGESNTFSGQSSLGSISSIGLLRAINTEQVMAESALLTNYELMLPQLADFQVPYSNNNRGGQEQFFGPLAGSNALNQIVQSDELSSRNRLVNGQSRGRGGVQKPDSMLVQHQSQWRPTQQMQRNSHLMIADNNNSNNDNVVIQKNQVFQNEPSQSCMTIYSQCVQAPAPTVSTTAVVPSKGPSKLSQQEIQCRVKLTLFLLHVRSCSAPVGHCPERNCAKAQQLMKHIHTCYQKQCRFHLCLTARTALRHFDNCQDVDCPVCVETHKSVIINKQKSMTLNSGSKDNIKAKEVNSKMETLADLVSLHTPVSIPVSASASAPPAVKHSKKCMNQLDASSGVFSDQMDAASGVMDVSKCSHRPLQQPPPKRRRMDMDISPVSFNNTNQPFSALQENFPSEQSICNTPVKHDIVFKVDPALQNLQITSSMSDMSSVQMDRDLEKNDENASEEKETEMEDGVAGKSGKPKIKGVGDVSTIRSSQADVGPAGPSEVLMHWVKKQESSLMVEPEERNDENASVAKEMEMEDGAAGMSGKPKINGVSLVDFFTPEQVREHIKSLSQWVGQSKAKAEKKQSILKNENSCQLCALDNLTFEPPAMFCYTCQVRIYRNNMYYTTGTGDQRHYICIPCFKKTKDETIEVEGHMFPKARLEKKKNNVVTGEAWVQCDKCNAWQHQICALFNELRNDCGQAEYTCPNCYIKDVETGECEPLPQSAKHGAKDLPRTILSDYIENRLFKQLKQERQERANHFGKNFDEVPGAEGLVVRVVSSVDKKFEVRPRFLEIFQKENYPTEFPYKSKAILLFQKIEGVEVCLFGMYVQEFGTECAFPNQRRVYLSYLDSVKYFRPEIRTVSGEALRTFVYHEILIGYLEYCKRRGFTSCYIWASPPRKGDNYIFYCHPEIQKTPKSVKLREWYLSMLKKAARENIVVDQTTLYDYLFTQQGESRVKVTAARLPYFDGDYWPGVAEDIITQLLSPEEDDHKQQKGKMKKAPITNLALKDADNTDLSDNALKDAMLMKKLHEKMYPMREDLIMVHLQHPCSHCHILMVSGTRWVCNTCQNFNLCDSCHKADQTREDRERHPTHRGETHTLTPVEINDVPDDTNDKDVVIQNKLFDTRQAFLALCMGKHYQHDTLRRAKHSSMMVLYHLSVEKKE